MSRSRNSRRGRKCNRPISGLTKLDRAIEHGRRRAALKREAPGDETKVERHHERWDKWNWD